MLDSEPLFLVDDKKPQVLEFNIPLQQSMGADYYIGFTGFKLFEGLPLLRTITKTGQHGNAHRKTAETVEKCFEVLFDQDSRRCQQGDLFAIHH